MVKLVCFVRRNPNLTVEEFHDHWTHRHAQLVLEHGGRWVRRYEQNHRLLKDYARVGGPAFDGCAIQWFDSVRDFFAMVADPGYQDNVGPDEQYLLDLDATTFLLTEDEHVVI